MSGILFFIFASCHPLMNKMTMNAKKTKFMAFNQQTVTKIQTQEPSLLEEVQDMKYLGAWVKSTEQDVKTRKAMLGRLATT